MIRSGFSATNWSRESYMQQSSRQGSSEDGGEEGEGRLEKGVDEGAGCGVTQDLHTSGQGSGGRGAVWWGLLYGLSGSSVPLFPSVVEL